MPSTADPRAMPLGAISCPVSARCVNASRQPRCARLIRARPALPHFRRSNADLGPFLAVLNEALRRLRHDAPTGLRILPALDLHPLAFEVFVDREEMRDLLQDMRIDL